MSIENGYIIKKLEQQIDELTQFIDVIRYKGWLALLELREDCIDPAIEILDPVFGDQSSPFSEYPEDSLTRRKAVVIRVNKDKGIAYANDLLTAYEVAFSFDKIQGYSGETAADLGIRKGRIVYIDFSKHNLAIKVHLTNADLGDLGGDKSKYQFSIRQSSRGNGLKPSKGRF